MLQRITLHLARTTEHPEGSQRHGYDIVAPLDAENRIDAAAWAEQRDLCRVRRFRPGEPDRHGWLVHRAGGSGGATWIVVIVDASTEDDEATYRLDRHVFIVGEYVSIRDEEEEMLPYRVAALQPVGGAR